MSENVKQPFLSHLEELRKRLINSFIAIFIVFAGTYFYAEELFAFFINPLKESLQEGEKLVYTHLPEMFFTEIKISLIAALLIASPYVFLQVWKFIAPGLYQNEKKYIIPFVVTSTILFVGGTLFAYYFVFPIGWKFFLGFENDNIRALPSVKEYFSFASKLLLAFGVAFELPLIIFFLSKMGIVSVAFLKKKRKYAILLTFIASAILTPPDPISQCMMAGPLIILYEIGVFFARFAEKKKEEREKEE